ncbi:tyrosine-type recombinase/integrase [Halobellus limi]|uniref:Site-specific integrase n=1 Tax=Halobellus limi TaxID=699433 RepID=A0A1H5SZ03_9EURY|nr:site-specific integrase [Halobellus limi]QCC47450.1 site-specific integrase [Halobellus limi]SEF55749.1 Site-specific recombinase XerD [Halobellus limi]
MSERNRRDPGALSPREAVERYLRRRKSDATEASVTTWRYRLKLFVEWCDDVGIERVDEIGRLDLDEYFGVRSDAVAPATLEGEMWTLRMFVDFLEDLGAVDDGFAEAVRIPDVDEDDRSNEVRLDAAAALPLLEYYREGHRRASREHVFLELAWVTGARQGGLRALDVRDAYLDEDYVDFVHRPGTGTPLKNKSRGERPVALPHDTTIVLEEWIDENRPDVRDDHGRAPLLASAAGRPVAGTVRSWSYVATIPCLHSACPHGRDRATCEWAHYKHASKCPSSRSPHQIRTGSITWQLDIGIPPEVVANRVNSSVSTIEQHYDVADPRERMEERRRHHINRKIDL